MIVRLYTTQYSTYIFKMTWVNHHPKELTLVQGLSTASCPIPIAVKGGSSLSKFKNGLQVNEYDAKTTTAHGVWVQVQPILNTKT